MDPIRVLMMISSLRGETVGPDIDAAVRRYHAVPRR